jgi:hypothetical protein
MGHLLLWARGIYDIRLVALSARSQRVRLSLCLPVFLLQLVLKRFRLNLRGVQFLFLLALAILLFKLAL